MEPSEGLETGGKHCKLLKSLYGLKQSTREWNLTIDKSLKKNGFKKLQAEHGIYDNGNVTIPLYVDDLLLVSKDISVIKKAKEMISSQFNMKDLGEVSKVLGIRVRQNRAKRTLTLIPRTL